MGNEPNVAVGVVHNLMVPYIRQHDEGHYWKWRGVATQPDAELDLGYTRNEEGVGVGPDELRAVTASREYWKLVEGFLRCRECLPKYYSSDPTHQMFSASQHSIDKYIRAGDSLESLCSRIFKNIILRGKKFPENPGFWWGQFLMASCQVQ